MRRRQAVRWGRSWTWGYRRGEWWIGVRQNFPCDGTEFNLFGLTLIAGTKRSAKGCSIQTVR